MTVTNGAIVEFEFDRVESSPLFSRARHTEGTTERDKNGITVARTMSTNVKRHDSLLLNA